jgi:hypothetical protein
MEGSDQLHARQYGYCREEINLLSLPGIKPQLLGCPVHNLVTILIELNQLPQRCMQYTVKMSLCLTKHCLM